MKKTRQRAGGNATPGTSSRPVLPAQPWPDPAVWPAHLPKARLRHILVPMDFSASGSNALAYAVLLARPSAARMTLLHVMESFFYPTEYGFLVPSKQTLAAQAKARLKAIAARSIPPAIRVKVALRAGTPWLEIVRASRALRPDLIVVATHGRVGLSRALLGSVAERVVRHAPCPVLAVRRQTETSGPARRSQARPAR